MVKKVVKTNPNLIELINKLYEQSSLKGQIEELLK